MFDSLVRRMVRDIIKLVKKENSGDFRLPEDLYHNQYFYEFHKLNSELQVDVFIVSDNTVIGFDVDAELFREEELIEVTIIVNPKNIKTNLQSLVGELNELLRHELEHVRQYEKGYSFPSEEPVDPEKYYLQPHEIEAQRAGFKRRAKKEKLSYEKLVRDWFVKNTHKHKLAPRQIERVIQKILEGM